MRILMINDFEAWVGGTGTFIYTIKKALEKRGHEVEILGSLQEENFASFFSRWYSFKWYRKTVQKIKEFKPDVVHINNCGRVLSPSPINASLNNGIPIVFTFQDFYFLPELTSSPKTWIGTIKRKLHQKVLKNKRVHFFAGSKVLADAMEKAIDMKVKIIHNGIVPSREKTNYKKNIIFVGELVNGKGLQTIADVLNRVKNYNVLILGIGALKEPLEKKYKNIKFLGFQKSGAFYKKSSIAVFPQTWVENLPYTVLEAASYGLGIIGANIGAIPEVVREKKTGLLFESGNKNEFEEKLDYFIKNPKEIKRMGNNARKLIKENFDWNKIVMKYEEQYRIAIKEFN